MQTFLVERLGLTLSTELLWRLILHAALILVVGIFFLRLIDSALKRVRSIVPPSDVAGARRLQQRAETLRHIVRSVGRAFLLALLVFQIAKDLTFNMEALLASAGIVGLAIGFGAQSLVKDVISGFFIILEDQYGVGDAVRIGSLDGVVEEMTLRVTVLRNFEGQVHIIPNGSIQTVTVFTKDWARAVLDVTVSHNADLNLVMDVLARIGSGIASDMRESLLEKPKVMGIERLSDEGATIRMAAKTLPGKQGAVLHEWRRRIVDTFQAEGIEMPQRNAQAVSRQPSASGVAGPRPSAS